MNRLLFFLTMIVIGVAVNLGLQTFFPTLVGVKRFLIYSAIVLPIGFFVMFMTRGERK